MSGTGKHAIDPRAVATIDVTVDQLSTGLTRYLLDLGLPTDSVLVTPAERMRVLSNVPAVVGDLQAEQRARAYYISKFIAACGVGLFDAALNFLWNETISNLREKVARFDLDYFLDSIIPEKRRPNFKSADDLDKLEDWELIRGCLETGIITEIGFKHLDYIRDIRNYASAAHPEVPDRPVAWLLLTARRLATDRWRRARRLARILVAGRSTRFGTTSGLDPDFDTWFASLASVLTARQREVLVLRYQRDLTDADIGSVMGLSESGVRSLVARALAVLRSHPELLS